MNNWTEKSLRRFLWSKRDRWHELIEEPPTALTQRSAFKVEDLSPEDLLWDLLRKRLLDDYHDARLLWLLGEEVYVAPEGGGAMFMDLFGVPYEAGTPGLGIVELKVSGKAARESFTELLAYGHGMMLAFPGLCRDDLLHVLVGPISEAPTIVRQALLGSLLLDRRRVVAFEPMLDQPTKGEVRLRPWVPDRADVALLGRIAFQEKNFVLEMQVWEDEDWWNETAMNSITARAALAMEAAGIHGFAFTSKSYPEINMPLPNALVCVGLNPFEIGLDMCIIERDQPSVVSLDDGKTLGPRISDILRGLRKSSEAGSCADDLQSMASVWSAHVSNIAYRTLRSSVRKSDGTAIMTDRGSLTWDQYLESPIENLFVTDYAIMPTGLVRELYETVVDLDYGVFAEKGEHPLHGDIFRYAEETLRSHVFFREFLLRMLQRGGGLAEFNL